MHGFIVVDADTGARLRRGQSALAAIHVLDASGAFRAGDLVHVVVRGRDGGQGVLACGVVGCDARDLARVRERRGWGDDGTDLAVMKATDVTLIWART